MGCYNTLIFKCPSCGSDIEEQSKGGSCTLSTYEAIEAPLGDLVYVEDEIIYCDKCKRKYQIKKQKIIQPYLQIVG